MAKPQHRPAGDSPNACRPVSRIEDLAASIYVQLICTQRAKTHESLAREAVASARSFFQALEEPQPEPEPLPE